MLRLNPAALVLSRSFLSQMLGKRILGGLSEAQSKEAEANNQATHTVGTNPAFCHWVAPRTLAYYSRRLQIILTDETS